jgi:RNA polymerase sigma-70 factor (ECF subfamily)
MNDDLHLVEICNHGDARDAANAFETLYKRHKDFVIRVALRFVPDNDSALDVLQETFTYLLRKFPPIGPGLTLTASLTSLLYPVAKNSALTLRRKSDRFPHSDDVLPDDLPAATNDGPSDIPVLLRGLPDERREVLVLRFVDDLSLQDIATALDIPLGTVKSRLHLALKALRESPEAKKLLLS